jgi:putative FmdB family regulatory protein
MPLYEYQCDGCAHRFEIIQKFSDPPVETCPRCGASVRKLLSSPAIQFKGSGWYITDYARAGKTDGAEKTAAKADGAASAAEAGSPAKAEPAAKTETKGAGGAKATAAPSTSG